MMATEATSENFVDATISAETEQTIITTIQDGTSEPPGVNGEFLNDNPKTYPEVGDGAVISAEVSISGGSDTETTKAETSKAQNDEKGHTRSASTVKKPASFKAVSVNKTFLSKGPTPAKLGDKGVISSALLPAAPVTSSTPRPRLVAKSGSGLRDSTPRSAAMPHGGKLGVAPDPSAVWNKNRPAPPPEQKRITDEELKEQYGIHLATRLQSDDPSRQANWADIDDDDDDWAPDSIEWTDGTKITLPQAEEISQSAPKALPPTADDAIRIESPKPKSPAPQTLSSATVKLGGISSGPGRGLILKGAAEKPTLVAKPPGPPTPVKSPWAALPPVDKAVPITSELQQPAHQMQQQQQQSTRFTQRDPHGFENMPPPPAKEIAADDFSRSWRDAGSSSNRELFNSQSGRYEPVNESRRGASRSDIHSRQPALLQRPSQQDQQGPAEPSPAFQTHRATGQDGGYGRRRTSSTVSGGSGNFVRRMSKGQEMHLPHDLGTARRGSLVAVTDPPSSPNNPPTSLQQPNPRGTQQQQWQSRGSPSASHASPASAHGQMAPAAASQPAAPGIPTEEDVELQKKIMRESRELARKRRLEEEAREEAARKERIRLKLEAMGPAPESKKSKKDISKEDKATPTQIQSRDGATTTISPPKPPIPEVAGEVKQYGLMKMHPPDSVAVEVKVKKVDEIRSATEEARPNGLHPSTAPSEGAETHTATNDARQPQSWQNAVPPGTERYSSWASPATHTAQGRNVWGPPPTNDRSLGNGTFNPDLSRLPEIHASQSSSMAISGPGPIGPPNPGRMNGQYQGRAREQLGQRPGPIGPPQRQPGPLRDQQKAQVKSAWGTLPEKLAQDDARARELQDKQDAARHELQAVRRESPLPQPVYKDTWKQVGVADDGTRSNVNSVSQTINDGSASTASSPWKEVSSHSNQEDATERSRFDQQEIAWRQSERSSAKIDAPQPVYKEAWRHVQVENGGRSETLNSTTINNGSSSTASPPVRGSRFFPQSRDIRLEDVAVSFNRPGSPSPPPPTMAGHPAYDGDTARPQVSLPRPSPVVKLPPPRVLAPIGPPKPAPTFAAAAAAPIVPNVAHTSKLSSYQQRPQEENSRSRNDPSGSVRPPHGPIGVGDWQDRINNLIGRRSSPPKTYVLAVDSASKNALELPATQQLATVSLPSSTAGDSSDDESQFETKPMAEECFEEQEMGSLPAIRVPNQAPEVGWRLAAPQTKSLPRRFVISEITSSDSIHFLAEISNDMSTVYIFLPGMTRKKSVHIPVRMDSRQKSSGRRQGASRGGPLRNTSSNHSRGGRPRDSSGGFSSPSLDHISMSSNPSSANRAGGRGRGTLGSHWNNHRHVSTSNSAINV